MINIKKIWENHQPTGDIIIKTKVDEIQQFDCFIATNHIIGQHLFILQISDNVSIPDLKSYRFKGVEFFVIDISKGRELNICLLDNDLKDIFALFIENVLEEISQCITEKESLNTTLNVALKWKKLFDKIGFGGLTLEEQKGLIGELLFLDFLLDNKENHSEIVDYWTSTEADFQAKDFTIKNIGVEVKFSTSKQPKIKISSEQQLDNQNLNSLYLVLYSANAVKDNGFSLNSLVEQIRYKINNDELRQTFDSKLRISGYYDADIEHYNKMYSLKKMFVFEITSQFPKITKNQLPLGIYDISYSIEISAVENFLVEPQFILEKI